MDEQAHKNWERKQPEQPDWNTLREQFGPANATFPTGHTPGSAEALASAIRAGELTPLKVPKTPPWAGASWEEKIERLRDEVATLRVRSEWWLSEVQRLQETIDRLIQHSHDALGHVVVPFRAQYGAGVGPKAQSTFDPLA